MRSTCRRPAIALTAALVSFGALRMSSAQTLITGDQTVAVDGWTITGWPGVALSVTSNPNGISIEKRANFTTAGQGLPIGFSQTAGGSTGLQVDFTDEQVANNTGQTFTGFDFIILNTGSAQALFAGENFNRWFTPPSDLADGYSFTSVVMQDAGQELIYTGFQNSGTTSDWGTNGIPLEIDTPPGSDFTLKELPTFGGPPGGAAVPLPLAAWQSLAGLALI
jgi:hypothetical protein